MKIKILLVEDDPVWRTMLAHFINNEPDLHIIQAVETRADAIQFCTHNKVDVVLMDINLSQNNLDGIQATLELNMMEIDTKVIALTSLHDEKVILDAFTAGVVQYVCKSDFRKIPDIIRGLTNTISPQEILVKEYLRMKEVEQYSKLTPAEKEIVILYREGNGRTSVQDKLTKTESTLKNQTTQILKKFNVKTIKEVIKVIKSRGLKF